MDPELECVSSSTGKSEGLGPLNEGMVFNISLAMSRRLMLPKPADQGALVLLDELGGQGVAFETAVGRNGRVWVNSKSVKETLAIGRAIQETDEKGLKVEEQKKLAKKVARET
jgi:exosome complex component RRP40